MKTQNLYLGKTINASTTASVLAWVVFAVSLFPAAAYVIQLITTGTIYPGAIIAFLFTMGLTFVLANINKRNPESQYAITRVIGFDTTGTKATRVRVQYRDGTYGEKTFAA